MMRGIVAGSLPASRAPFSKRPISILIFSSAAPTVMMPSQVRPVRSAFTGPESPRRWAAALGCVYSRALSRLKCWPRYLTTLPLNSLRMTSIPSARISSRATGSGQ